MILYIIILVLVGIILFFLSAGFFLYKKMFRRITKNNSKQTNIDKKLMEHTVDPIIMNPLNDAKERWINNTEKEKHTIIGEKGITLRGSYWTSDKENSSYLAILVHGLTDSEGGMAYLAEEYHKRNIDVFLVNLAAHGTSDGEYFGLGFRDGKDIIHWIEYFEEKKPGKKYILHGVSMGAGTILNCVCDELLYKNNFEDKVLFAAADSAFSSFEEEVENQMKIIFTGGRFIHLQSYFLRKALSFYCFIYNGFTFNKDSPETRIRNRKENQKKVPILIFQGLSDSLILPYMALKIYDAIGISKGIRKLVLTENALHIGSYFYSPVVYMKAVDDFISECEKS